MIPIEYVKHLGANIAMPTTNGRGPSMSPDVLAKIEELYFSTTPAPTAAAIHRSLRATFGATAPRSARAIEKRVAKLRPHDPSGTWRMDAPRRGVGGVDSAAALRVLAANIEYSGGVRPLTNREAQWITVIVAAAPTIPPVFAYHLARHYIMSEQGSGDRDGLDRILALRVWESRDHYEEAIAQGWVPRLWVSHFTRADDTVATNDTVASSVSHAD